MALSPVLLLMPAPVRALVISVTQLLPSNSFLWMTTEATSRFHSWGPAAGEANTPLRFGFASSRLAPVLKMFGDLGFDLIFKRLTGSKTLPEK